MRSKGISLPTNTLIILIIAVIVLLAVVALFMSGILSWESINLSRAVAQGCTKYVNLGCKENQDFSAIDTDVDIDGDGVTDTFDVVLKKAMGAGYRVNDVQKRCGCQPVV